MHRLLLLAFLLLPSTAVAQSNVLKGTAAWKSVVFAPDPAWSTGTTEGIQDQRCEVTNSTWDGGWAGGPANQIFAICASVPHPQTGAWNTGYRMQGYTGHLTQQWFAGYELSTEGKRVNGVETVNRLYLWAFDPSVPGGRGIFHRDLQWPNSFVFGEGNRPLDVYVTGGVDSRWVGSVRYYAVTVNPDGSQVWREGYSHQTKECAGAGTRWQQGLCVTVY